MITYGEPDAKGNTPVRIAGKTVGWIERVTEGFRYYPKGSVTGGDKFPTLEACKQSLEAK